MSQWKLVLLFSEILLEAASHVQIADVSANIKMSGIERHLTCMLLHQNSSIEQLFGCDSLPQKCV